MFGGGGEGGAEASPPPPNRWNPACTAQDSLKLHELCKGLQGVNKVASCWKLGVETCIEEFQHIIYASTSKLSYECP